jgi:hypothetical protein
VQLCLVLAGTWHASETQAHTQCRSKYAQRAAKACTGHSRCQHQSRLLQWAQPLGAWTHLVAHEGLACFDQLYRVCMQLHQPRRHTAEHSTLLEAHTHDGQQQAQPDPTWWHTKALPALISCTAYACGCTRHAYNNRHQHIVRQAQPRTLHRPTWWHTKALPALIS